MVEKVITNVNYLINKNNKKEIFHINMLRKYYERPYFLKRMINGGQEEEMEKANSLLILPDNEGKDEDIH